MFLILFSPHVLQRNKLLKLSCLLFCCRRLAQVAFLNICFTTVSLLEGTRISFRQYPIGPCEDNVPYYTENDWRCLTGLNKRAPHHRHLHNRRWSFGATRQMWVPTHNTFVRHSDRSQLLLFHDLLLRQTRGQRIPGDTVE